MHSPWIPDTFHLLRDGPLLVTDDAPGVSRPLIIVEELQGCGSLEGVCNAAPPHAIVEDVKVLNLLPCAIQSAIRVSRSSCS